MMWCREMAAAAVASGGGAGSSPIKPAPIAIAPPPTTPSVITLVPPTLPAANSGTQNPAPPTPNAASGGGDSSAAAGSGSGGGANTGTGTAAAAGAAASAAPPKPRTFPLVGSLGFQINPLSVPLLLANDGVSKLHRYTAPRAWISEPVVKTNIDGYRMVFGRSSAGSTGSGVVGGTAVNPGATAGPFVWRSNQEPTVTYDVDDTCDFWVAVDGDGQYMCKICAGPKVFAELHMLNRHMRGVHGSENKAVPQCRFNSCGKRFADINKLKKHQTVHSTEKPYVCGYPKCCPTLRFASESELLLHQTVLHTSETPHVCPHASCLTAAVSSATLASNSGKTPVIAAFASPIDLAYHLKTMHAMNTSAAATAAGFERVPNSNSGAGSGGAAAAGGTGSGAGTNAGGRKKSSAQASSNKRSAPTASAPAAADGEDEEGDASDTTGWSEDSSVRPSPSPPPAPTAPPPETDYARRKRRKLEREARELAAAVAREAAKVKAAATATATAAAGTSTPAAGSAANTRMDSGPASSPTASAVGLNTPTSDNRTAASFMIRAGSGESVPELPELPRIPSPLPPGAGSGGTS